LEAVGNWNQKIVPSYLSTRREIQKALKKGIKEIVLKEQQEAGRSNKAASLQTYLKRINAGDTTLYFSGSDKCEKEEGREGGVGVEDPAQDS